MKQRVKIITNVDESKLEEEINKFLDEYEARGIQVIATPLSEPYIDPICYTAVIKYFEVEQLNND